jgi:hypothetical protein
VLADGKLAESALGEKSLASYAVTDGALFIRSEKNLYRIAGTGVTYFFLKNGLFSKLFRGLLGAGGALVVVVPAGALG